MSITLSPETQRLLEETLKSGPYHSADEVVHAALDALRELRSTSSLDDDTLAAIDRSEDQIALGEVYDWNDVRDRVRDKFLRG